MISFLRNACSDHYCYVKVRIIGLSVILRFIEESLKILWFFHIFAALHSNDLIDSSTWKCYYNVVNNGQRRVSV